jgi:hypothetical protein
MRTPWGKPDSKTTLARGISFVTTPSHGGFMVALAMANRFLSVAANRRGLKYGDYLAFEEDGDALIVLLELPVSMLEKLGGFPTVAALVKSLSIWHADYLLERGITPDLEGLKFFNENRQADRVRADKSPDLIVSASGDWAAWVPKGRVDITTADGKRYTVPASEYAPKTLNLLSQHTDVQAVQLPATKNNPQESLVHGGPGMPHPTGWGR